MAAHRGQMSGYVSVGLPPTTATVLALPLINAMRARYPYIQLHLVEMLSGHLAAQLNARQIDLAILFQLEGGKRWSVTPLLDEKLFVIASPSMIHVVNGALDGIGLAYVPDFMAKPYLADGRLVERSSEAIQHIVPDRGDWAPAVKIGTIGN